jgi:DNA-binding FadR family transcriptional regulator
LSANDVSNLTKESTRIADQIRNRINRGHLRPGDKLLSEKELGAFFQVSRPTLREALRLLESEGLINIMRGGGGVRVRLPDIDPIAARVAGYLQRDGADFEDIYTARMLIEPIAASLFADHATRDAIRQLEANTEQAEEAITDKTLFGLLNFEFSRLIVDHCGNRTIALLGRLVQRVMETQIDLSDDTLVLLSQDDMIATRQVALDLRRRLIAAIKDRDGHLAADVRTEQMRTTYGFMRSAYGLKQPVEKLQTIVRRPGGGVEN